jgi:alkanesulfonate monooxygenase SsuD/methylene tetrahydromethanopterin reductase-like flavin-dependent oxidoreductase (luciferase family)
MRCEDAVETMRTVGSQPGANLRVAMDHVVDCEDCQAALRAIDALRALRDEPTEPVGDAVIQRAVDRALAMRPVERYRRGFWAGMASGAAIAAAVAALAVGLWFFGSGNEARNAVPQVRVALNERSDVTVALESPEPLSNAEVHVELRGAVELAGYAGQRELRWSTDLDRGINQLTLPVVAIDASGGQVLVEVTHGQKRRAFVLDVRAAAPG